MTAQKKLQEQNWTSGCRCITKKFNHLEIKLNKSQLLVGSSENVDFKIEHPSIAFYHALFLVSDEHVEILDLSPFSQLTVNGRVCKRQHLYSGDRFTIGQLEFTYEAPEADTDFEERNAKFKKFAPPPVPSLKVVPQESANTGMILPKGSVFVDGELCNLKISEDFDFTKIDNDKILDVSDISRTYIDIEEREVLNFYPEKIKKEEETIILSYFCMGQLVAMDTFSGNAITGKKLKKNHLSPELAQWWRGEEAIISFDNGNYYFHSPSAFGPASANHCIEEEVHSATFGVHHFTFQKRVLRKDAKFLGFWRDKDSFFTSVAYFFAIVLPSLLLLLVDIPKFEEPEKEKVIIYTTEVVEEADEPKPVAAGAVEMQNQNNKEAQQAPVVDPNKGQPDKQVAEQKQEKSEPEKPKPAEQVANKFASLFSKSKLPVDEKKFADQSSSSTTSNDAHRKALSGSTVGGQAKTVGGGQIKGIAVDAGLSGKKGFKDGKGVGKGDFDSSFTSAKTVVLGSIDPELLRKLLREYIPQFRYCYQNELIKNPNLSGTLTLNFTLNGKGKVSRSNVVAKGSAFSQKGLSCMDGVLKMIPFPAPKGGGQVDVKQPLNFSAERTKL